MQPTQQAFGTQGPLVAVSLTGADDKVSVSDLHHLTREFPFVEWAVLYLSGRDGTPRNPSREWREKFGETLNTKGRFNAVHLCGARSFHELREGRLPADLFQFHRVQLNLNPRRIDFSDSECIEMFEAAYAAWPRTILQYHNGTATAIQTWLSQMKEAGRSLTSVDVLIDYSQGKGIAPAQWGLPEGFPSLAIEQDVGLAGGIGPHNIEQVILQGCALDRRFWVDMETGIRTDNELDLEKVYSVLTQSAPFWKG